MYTDAKRERYRSFLIQFFSNQSGGVLPISAYHPHRFYLVGMPQVEKEVVFIDDEPAHKFRAISSARVPISGLSATKKNNLL